MLVNFGEWYFLMEDVVAVRVIKGGHQVILRYCGYVIEFFNEDDRKFMDAYLD